MMTIRNVCRRERKNRDAFRALLSRHRDDGSITVHSRWKAYAAMVEDSEEYQAVKKNASGSRPKELFEDIILVGGFVWVVSGRSSVCMCVHV
jgi:pre-mRNA-processing factor 40